MSTTQAQYGVLVYSLGDKVFYTCTSVLKLPLPTHAQHRLMVAPYIYVIQNHGHAKHSILICHKYTVLIQKVETQHFLFVFDFIREISRG